MIRLATSNGARVDRPRTYARLADCDGELWRGYQDAKAAWDAARVADDPDPDRERKRWAAINSYDAWALSCGVAPIQAPNRWGFN